ncbi:MAG TPA: SCO family protein [Methylomirabilota bacterium]|jgi:protein SCO1/2|nr:SCO family protein [Methylomirabilota bacterium]
MSTRSKVVAMASAAMLLAVVAVALAERWGARSSESGKSEATLEDLGDYGEVPPFTLIERSGRRVTRADLRRLISVVDFIYTECKETCPTQSLQFARLQQEFVGAADLRFVSITVDPAHDTVEVLRRYAERYGAGDRWWFLTGDKRDIYCLARHGFRLGVTDPAAPDQPACGQVFSLGPASAWASHGSGGLIMHSARLALVDRRGHIRAYHLATDTESITRLRANLRELLDMPLRERGTG